MSDCPISTEDDTHGYLFSQIEPHEIRTLPHWRWIPSPFGLSVAQRSRRPPDSRLVCSSTSPLARLRSERTVSVFSICATLYQCHVFRFSNDNRVFRRFRHVGGSHGGRNDTRRAARTSDPGDRQGV